MYKTELYYTTLETIKQTPIWRHLETLNLYATKLTNSNISKSDKNILFDYVIEIIKLRPSSIEDANYWIKLNVFMKKNRIILLL
ncbi:hypothetical protein DS745_07505 [Anaerobacillus alkaliphilus]|uniref:Uncharacterized protein n=1 Tax=Anaerobacillus alkaliphilus TaxID=1548597 RepID=A0A4Q0VU68_9BACI|nr:hypothetical protein DS745_07505 [Anaerobacillus alkaliphilus]